MIPVYAPVGTQNLAMVLNTWCQLEKKSCLGHSFGKLTSTVTTFARN